MTTYRCRFVISNGNCIASAGYAFNVTANDRSEANEKALRVIASKLFLQIEEYDPSKHTKSQGAIGGAIEPWASLLEPLNVEIVDKSAANDGSVGPIKFWISWYHDAEAFSDFHLEIPHWHMGDDVKGRARYCAAVKATSADGAQEVIWDAYQDPPNGLSFRFCDEKPDDWHPFTSKRPKRGWMIWNDHAQPREEK